MERQAPIMNRANGLLDLPRALVWRHPFLLRSTAIPPATEASAPLYPTYQYIMPTNSLLTHPKSNRLGRRVLFELIGSVDPQIRAGVAAVAFDGTSATALLVDPRDPAHGVLAPAKLYNEAQTKEVVAAAKVGQGGGGGRG